MATLVGRWKITRGETINSAERTYEMFDFRGRIVSPKLGLCFGTVRIFQSEKTTKVTR